MSLAWFLLPRSRNLAPRARFDWAGLALFGPAVVAFLLALNIAGSIGLTHLTPLLLLTASAAIAAVFVRRERRTQAPMIDLGLFRRIDFTAGIAAGLLSYLVLFGVLFVVPFFLEHAQHLSPTRAGIELGVLPVALGLAAPFAGRARDRIGARLPTVAGMLLTAALLVCLAVEGHDRTVFVLLLAGIGVGLGAFTPANNAAIMAAVPARHSGMAGGVLNLTRGLGTSFGVAATGLVLGLRNAQQPGAPESAVVAGFRACAMVLAAIALLAAALAWLRTPNLRRADISGRRSSPGDDVVGVKL